MGIPTAEFVTRAAEGDAKEITGIIPVETFLVQYKDGDGNKQVRMCFRPHGTDVTFILKESMQGQPLVTSATGWFKSAFSQALAKLGLRRNRKPTGELDAEGVESF